MKGCRMNQKMRFAGIGVLVGMCGLSSAMLPPPAPQPGERDHAEGFELLPSIEVLNPITDLGTVYDNAPQKFTLRFKNVGAAELEILSTKADCGCTVPDLDKMETTTFQPGEVGEVDVTFNPKGKNGRDTRKIRLATNDPSNPVAIFELRSFVKKLVIAPNVVNFLTIGKGESTLREFRVLGRTEDFDVPRITAEPQGRFDIEISEPKMVEVDGEELRGVDVTVSLKGSASPGAITGNLYIRTTDKRRPMVSVPVRGAVRGDLRLRPTRFSLGLLKIGDSMDREIRVTHASGEAFEVTKASLNIPALDAQISYEPVDPELRNEWVVKLAGTAAAASTNIRGKLVIQTSVEGESKIEVPFYGVIRE